MNKTIENLGQSAAVFCLVAALSGIAAAENVTFNNDGRQFQTLNFVIEGRTATSTSDEESRELYRKTQMASAAIRNGEVEQAQTIAETILKQAETLKEDWNYGNAVHVAHLVLGQIALNAGNMDEAKRLLLEAGKTPGSPQLKTFGPNMLLAKNLLAKQERETVLKYFELCAKFWKDKDGKLSQWKATVLNGETPDFGNNLVY